MAGLAICLLVLVSTQAIAQSAELDSRISQIKEQFQQLDASASSCLDDIEDACQNFLDQLNQELPLYLQHCDYLLAWRERLVEDNANGVDTSDAGLAQQLIDVEYTCGDNALTRRTSAVLLAYDKIHASPISALPALLADSTNRAVRQETLRKQNSVTNSLIQQQQRLGNEIEQQWQRIQLQNLREENRRPRQYGTFDN